MKDEIKKILEELKDASLEEYINGEIDYDYYIHGDKAKKLLDCITNLQEENKELKIETEKLTQLWLDSQENKRKAIEYIKAVGVRPKEIDSFVLLNILKGEDKDE